MARPSIAEVTEACAAELGGEEVRAYVVGTTVTDRLLYAVTDRDVAIIRLGSRLRGRLEPKEFVASWPRGSVEVEAGISSIRVGPHRAKVRFAQRRTAAEVARQASRPA